MAQHRARKCATTKKHGRKSMSRSPHGDKKMRNPTMTKKSKKPKNRFAQPL